MMKRIFLLWGCLLLIAMTACEKDTLASIFAPEVETGTAENIYRKGATLSGSIRFSEGMAAESYGILFSKYQSLAESQEMPVTSDETDFSIPVQDLEPNETYYFCSYANSGYSMVRGEVRSFTTSSSNAPVFQTPVVSDTTVSSFHITATLLDDGGSELMLSGFCYGEGSEKLPTFMDQVKNIELSGNSISATITGLYPNTTYQIRAYGASKNGLAYSDLVTVTTQTAVVPFLANVECTDSTYHSVTITSDVLETGSATVTEAGFCYSSSNTVPTLSDEVITINGYSSGSFETTIEDLNFNTTYYIRAYAKNSYGTGYSEVFTYTPAQPEVAYLIDGPTFNERIKQLANDVVSSRAVDDTDNLIAKIKFTTNVQTLPAKYVTVSAEDSSVPAYASFSATDSLLTVFTPAKDMEIVDASYLFYKLYSLRKIEFEDFTISETTTKINYMFSGCQKLTSLDVSLWNTVNVTDMTSAFNGCSELMSLAGISNWNTKNVTKMSWMFESCKSLVSLNLSQWETANVTDMTYMFDYCLSMTSLNASNWNVSKVTNMGGLLGYCSSLTSLDISQWNLNDNIQLGSMFAFCSSTPKACEITATQETQKILLGKKETTGMETEWFIWTNGTVDDEGSDIEDMPNQEW